jgi:hypothetical protein
VSLRTERPPATASSGSAADGEGAPKRQKHGIRDRFKAAEDFISPVVKVLAVVGVVLAVAEYSDRLQTARIEAALKQVEAWDANGFRESYLALNDQIWPLFEAQRGFIASLSEGQREKVYRNIGESVTGQDNRFDGAADKAVDKVTYFFDRAALCVHQGICDYNVIDAFVGSDIRDFWRYFYSYAERRRAAGYSEYGRWTQRFAEGSISRASVLGFL